VENNGLRFVIYGLQVRVAVWNMKNFSDDAGPVLLL